jgi:hypothetical protein
MSLQADLRGGVAAEDGRITNVTPQHFKTCVPRVPLDVERIHTRLDRRRCQPGPEGVPGELPGVEPEFVDAALHDERHCPVREPRGTDPVGAVHRAEDRPRPDAGSLEPGAESPDRAGVFVLPVVDSHLAAVAALVGLPPADGEDEPLVAEPDIPT